MNAERHTFDALMALDGSRKASGGPERYQPESSRLIMIGEEGEGVHDIEVWFRADAAALTGLKYGCAMASFAVSRS